MSLSLLTQMVSHTLTNDLSTVCNTAMQPLCCRCVVLCCVVLCCVVLCCVVLCCVVLCCVVLCCVVLCCVWRQ